MVYRRNLDPNSRAQQLSTLNTYGHESDDSNKSYAHYSSTQDHGVSTKLQTWT